MIIDIIIFLKIFKGLNFIRFISGFIFFNNYIIGLLFIKTRSFLLILEGTRTS